MKSFIKKIRLYGRLISALNGFLYDFYRFYLFSAWRSDMKDAEQRNYNAVKIYHTLEKSMSLKNRRLGAGQSSAYILLDVLKYAKKSNNIGFHDKAALSTLSRFVELDGINKVEWVEQIRKELLAFDFFSDEVHGSQIYRLEDFRKGMLENPEKFFFSRHSLREFKNEIVPEHVVKRAVSLALKTPSVCNRQAWHVYHTSDSDIKYLALKYQEGNRGFGDRVPNLMIITTDLKAFVSGYERYQHWIDGGLFAMSIIYALHSLGVASCCLNWSQTPAKDKMLRSLVDIRPNHTVVMMLAIGWPDENNNICVSARRPLDEVYSSLNARRKL
ncbi:MAG: nitroreductase family protein [bacterium]|nr:nitroreductase family protein [bacterium]